MGRRVNRRNTLVTNLRLAEEGCSETFDNEDEVNTEQYYVL